MVRNGAKTDHWCSYNLSLVSQTDDPPMNRKSMQVFVVQFKVLNSTSKPLTGYINGPLVSIIIKLGSGNKIIRSAHFLHL